MTSETTTRICEHLEKYVFDKIWNDPYSEYRTFIVPECLSNVATAGVFFGRYDHIQLPSEVSYRDKNVNLFFYLYSVPASYFRSLKVNAVDSWVSLDKLGSSSILDFEFFSSQGKRCLRAGTFIKQSPNNDCMYIAIETTAFATCFGSTINPDGTIKRHEDEGKQVDFFFGKYVDSDLEASVTYESFRLKSSDLPSSGSKSSNYDPVTASGVPTYAFYNGSLLTGDYQTKLAAGGLVEKVTDGNIEGYFDVPVTLDTVYQPEGTSYTKLLVHIPKSLNKDSSIITPNTCDMYLVPTKMKEGAGSACFSSVYLYQCGRGDYFTQLTHNDFSIDYTWLRLLMNINEIDECVLRVFVRKPIKDKHAIRDAHYLNLLYTHTDEEIVAFLLNKGIYDIPFWTAQSLENSLYGLATLKRRDLDRPYELSEFVKLLGYYHTLALIGKRVTHFEVLTESTGTREFVVNAPLALGDFKAGDFFPLVYVNGIRIDQSNIEIRTGIHASNQHCKEITFTPDASWWTKVVDMAYSTKLRIIVNNVPLKVGDKVVVELLDNQGDARECWFTVTSGHTEQMTTDKYAVYIVHDETDLDNVSYEKVENPGEFDEETNTLTFSEDLVGQKVIVIDGSMTRECKCHPEISHSSTYYLGNGMWNPMSDVDNFPRESEIVFLNDKSLIRGLDYTMEGYRYPNRRYGAQVYVQNVSYLKRKNDISVILTDQKTLSHQRGFLTGNIVTWNHQNPFWFDELSIMTIDGRVCSNLIHEFGTITINDTHDNGVPYEYRMSVSSRVADILNDTDKSEDDERLRIIQAYFDSRYKFPDHITIVKHPHRIYSLYLEQIISDFMQPYGFDFQLLASQQLFEEQFAAYTEWKKRDVAFNLSELDLMYVDVSPTYNTLQISNGFQYHKLKELIRRLMPKDAHRYKDTRNVR